MDNFFYKAIEVDIPPIPDLIATNVIPPYEHFAGDTITISWELINQGGAAFEDIPVTDNIYMSTKNVFDADARMLGAYRDTISMGRDEVIRRVAYLPTNERDLEEYYFFVETDVRNQVYESLFEDNNVSPASEFPTDFLLVPPPDLVFSDFMLYKDILSPNEKFKLSYNVMNNGFRNTGGFDDLSEYVPCEDKVLPPLYGNPWRDVVYISKLDTFNIAESKVLATYYNNKVLWTYNELNVIKSIIDEYVWCMEPDPEYPPEPEPDENGEISDWQWKQHEKEVEQYYEDLENQELRREALRVEMEGRYNYYYDVELEITIPAEYDKGTYYIYVITDQGDNIFEHIGEENNIVSDIKNENTKTEETAPEMV